MCRTIFTSKSLNALKLSRPIKRYIDCGKSLTLRLINIIRKQRMKVVNSKQNYFSFGGITRRKHFLLFPVGS